ncbi:MAG: OmpA family protein [Bacteroidetes bacterium]|nr:OmpA family protein [Bacteroidota bacterium]
MKTLIYLFSMMFFLSLPFSANAQWNIKEKAKKKLEEKLSESKQKEKEEQETEVTKQDISNENASDKKISGTAEQPQTHEEQLKAWSNYNFVPGDKVIFEDDLLWEENGEFPSKWDLMRGIAENAMIGNEKVIKFSIDEDIIFPLMETEEDYLPEKFTIEFDAYFNREIDENGNPTEDWETKYYVWLWNIKNVDGDYFAAWAAADRVDNDLQRITLEYNKVSMFDRYKGQIPWDPSEEKLSSKWRHVAIEFNIRSLKVYLDQHRLLNIPNIKCNPSAFFLGNESDDAAWIPGAPDVLIKNIRIAEGGKKYYERFMTDGKIVTTGIKFASGKSDVKPESMGVINKIVQLMNQHPEINFSIEGHTDSDGDDASNQVLSEKRAEAIKAEFVRLGISDNRLKTNGWGESKPVDENSTPEGKANNRRVEFVKF